jgi:triacylglycerol lipase
MSFLTSLPEQLYDRNAFRDFTAAETFSLENARAMMWLSQLAYEEVPEKIGRIARLWAFDRIEIVHGAISTRVAVHGTTAIVAARPTAVMVAFAGTDPLKLANWVTDFTLNPIPEETHQGFANAADEIWSRLKPLIDVALASHAGARLLFAGHSLGATLTALSAEKARASHAVSAVYTFGMPRVGTDAFRQRYAELSNRTYRLRFGEDVVPGVPTLGMGYRHVGLYLHCRAGRFDGSPRAAEEGSDDTSVFRSLREVGDFLRRPSLDLPLLTGPRTLLPPFLSPAPPVRPDLLGVVLEQLPPPIRDHLPHRYLGAL